MANLSDKKTKLKAKEFNIYRRKMLPKGSTLTLLRLSGREAAFNVVGTPLERDFLPDWNNNRQEMTFEIARNDDDIKADLLKATHCSFNGQVYAFADGDFVFQPFYHNDTWKRTGKFTGQTYP